jgi:hypothetical protein
MEGIFGLISNGAGIILTHPIDVIKTNYQLQLIKSDMVTDVKKINKSNSIITSITNDIFRSRGLKGFYSGITPNLATYPVFWAVYFGTNQILNKNDYKYFTNVYLNKFFSSYLSSMIGSTFTNPLFVIKTRMQNTARQNKSVISTIHDINTTGAKTYFRGLNTTFLNNTKLAFQFPMYDYIKDNTGSIVGASIGSKAISSTLLYPFDLMRTIQRNSDTKVSMINIAKSIHKRNGVTGLYNGVMLYNAVSTPNFVIMMCLFELLKERFKQ